MGRGVVIALDPHVFQNTKKMLKKTYFLLLLLLLLADITSLQDSRPANGP